MQRRSLQTIALSVVAIIVVGYLLSMGRLKRLPDDIHVGGNVFIDEKAGSSSPIEEHYFGKRDDYYLSSSQRDVSSTGKAVSPAGRYRITGLYRLERKGLNRLKEASTDFYLLNQNDDAQPAAKHRLFLLKVQFDLECEEQPPSAQASVNSAPTYRCPRTDESNGRTQQ